MSLERYGSLDPTIAASGGEGGATAGKFAFASEEVFAAKEKEVAKNISVARAFLEAAVLGGQYENIAVAAQNAGVTLEDFKHAVRVMLEDEIAPFPQEVKYSLLLATQQSNSSPELLALYAAAYRERVLAKESPIPLSVDEKDQEPHDAEARRYRELIDIAKGKYHGEDIIDLERGGLKPADQDIAVYTVFTALGPAMRKFGIVLGASGALFAHGLETDVEKILKEQRRSQQEEGKIVTFAEAKDKIYEKLLGRPVGDLDGFALSKEALERFRDWLRNVPGVVFKDREGKYVDEKGLALANPRGDIYRNPGEESERLAGKITVPVTLSSGEKRFVAMEFEIFSQSTMMDPEVYKMTKDIYGVPVLTLEGLQRFYGNVIERERRAEQAVMPVVALLRRHKDAFKNYLEFLQKRNAETGYASQAPTLPEGIELGDLTRKQIEGILEFYRIESELNEHRLAEALRGDLAAWYQAGGRDRVSDRVQAVLDQYRIKPAELYRYYFQGAPLPQHVKLFSGGRTIKLSRWPDMAKIKEASSLEVRLRPSYESHDPTNSSN